MRREVVGEGTVSVWALAQLFAIDPHGGVGHGSVEFDRKDAVFEFGREREGLTVKSGAGDGKCSGVRIQLGIEWQFDRPIVRKANVAPVRIVKLDSLRAVCRLVEELPSVVEAGAALGLTGVRGLRASHRGDGEA